MKLSPLTLLAPILFTAFSLAAEASAAHEVTRYSVIQKSCEDENGTLSQAIRSFQLDRVPHLLTVDTETLEIRVVPANSLHCDSELAEKVKASRYGRALGQSSAPPYPLSNDGMRRSSIGVKGVFLTADLCPAGDGKFEHRFFNELEAIAGKTGEATPIALAITGKWIRRHAAEFDEIIHLIAKRKIEVTWMNHSDTHPYVRGVPAAENFLLTPGTNTDAEIETVEIELLKRGQVPSVFFRFPGLISNQAWIENLNRHSLIAIGSDAWLALDQTPKTGSIILVHANGNEPLGITRFLKSILSIEALGSFLPLSKLF